MSVRSLQHIALAVPIRVGRKFYTRFRDGGKRARQTRRHALPRPGPDQVVLVEGKKKHMHHVGFGTKPEDLRA